MKVSDLFKVKKTDGDVGIEVECEGDLSMFESPFWQTVPENSLRNGGLEFISRGAVKISDLSAAMEEFSIATKKMKIRSSIRTSVHVHVNVQNYTIDEIYNVIGCFWLIENLLVKMNGENRKGNLFCLRASDAEDFVFQVLQSAKENMNFLNFQGAGNQFRYASLNLTSLFKYGSVEFRFMKGMSDPDEIFLWVKSLWYFVRVSRNYDLSTVISYLNEKSTEDFLGEFLPPVMIGRIFKEFSVDQIKTMIMEGYCYTLHLIKALENKTKHRPIINYSEDVEPDEIKEIYIKSRNQFHQQALEQHINLNHLFEIGAGPNG